MAISWHLIGLSQMDQSQLRAFFSLLLFLSQLPADGVEVRGEGATGEGRGEVGPGHQPGQA